MTEQVSGPGGASQKRWSILNETHKINGTMPLELTFNHANVITITFYSILMFISATGNLTVLVQLLKRRRAGRASRLDVLLMHLAVADLMVTFLPMPLEIAWAYTVQWLAGDMMCRIMMFTRTFGLYVSSFILICIAIDRYYAILKPLNVTWEAWMKRAIGISWVFAVLTSLPQVYIFHLQQHPKVDTFYQCVSFDSLPTWKHELAYFIVNMILMYIVPLVSTLYCSTAAILEIKRRANTANDRMRRSGIGILGRAKARTLKMTFTIVIVFFTCWTPYYCSCIWYWADSEYPKKVHPALQKGLWLFSCTNSCANPIVYGIFNRNRWFWKRNSTNRCRNGSLRRGSQLPYGDSMEISAAALARARNSCAGRSLNGERRDSTHDKMNGFQKNGRNWFNEKNGCQKSHLNNNNNVSSEVV